VQDIKLALLIAYRHTAMTLAGRVINTDVPATVVVVVAIDPVASIRRTAFIISRAPSITVITIPVMRTV
jgi:hypothetical protein